MAWSYGDWERRTVSRALNSNGGYSLFCSWGRGYTPCGEWIDTNDRTLIDKIPEIPAQSHRWDWHPDRRITYLMKALKDCYEGELGVFYAKGEAFKPYEKHAWEVRDVKYAFKAHDHRSMVAFKLIRPELDEQVSHFLKTHQI